MRITPAVTRKTLTAATSSQVTTDTSIWAQKAFIQADAANTGTCFVGGSDLDATSATTLKNTCWYSLLPSQIVELPMGDLQALNNEAFRLSDVYASSTVTGDVVRVLRPTEASS